MKKKERKIKNIRTYYLANEDFGIQEKIEDIASKERVNLSNVIVDAMKEYVEKHGDGNPVYSLDHFQDPDFKICPAVFRNLAVWKKYYSEISKKVYHEMDSQLNMILTVHNKKLMGLS